MSIIIGYIICESMFIDNICKPISNTVFERRILKYG